MQNRRKYNKLNFIAAVFLSSAFLYSLVSCEKKEKHEAGEKLAKIQCASCHMFSDPSVLPRRVWGEKILPNMGLKMGMSHGPIYSYGDSETTDHLTPTLSQEDWDKIVHYYLNTSENSIPKNTIQELQSSNLFEPHLFSIDSLSVLSMTAYDDEKSRLFWVMPTVLNC